MPTAKTIATIGMAISSVRVSLFISRPLVSCRRSASCSSSASLNPLSSSPLASSDSKPEIVSATWLPADWIVVVIVGTAARIPATPDAFETVS